MSWLLLTIKALTIVLLLQSLDFALQLVDAGSSAGRQITNVVMVRGPKHLDFARQLSG